MLPLSQQYTWFPVGRGKLAWGNFQTMMIQVHSGDLCRIASSIPQKAIELKHISIIICLAINQDWISLFNIFLRGLLGLLLWMEEIP